MPVEALREAKFSHKSDVFAFGVLLWETLSLGQTPWGAFAVKDFVDALQRGERLQFPPAVATNPVALAVYAVCMRCWELEPRKRPRFVQLENELAVQVTVAAATHGRPTGADAAAGAGVSARAGAPPLAMRDGTDAVELTRLGAAAALDLDGYVEEQIVLSPSSASASFGCLNDHDGYVADPNVAAVCVPQLDHVGYAADLLAGDEDSPAPPPDSGMDAWEQTTVPRASVRYAHEHEEAGSTRI
jgi:hypothetical protein